MNLTECRKTDTMTNRMTYRREGDATGLGCQFYI